MRKLRNMAFILAGLVILGSGAKADPMADVAHRQAPALATGSVASWTAVLRDYRSAQFKNVHAFYMHGDAANNVTPFWYLCGKYNARNGFDGYAGWEGFAVVPTEGGIAVIAQGAGPYDFGTNIKMEVSLCTDAVPSVVHSEFTDRDYAALMTYHGR